MNLIDSRSENAVEDIANSLTDILNNCDDVVIVNIGTDRCVGDSVGPLLGTLLSETNIDIPVYGTLEDPIHALNLKAKIQEIKEKHPYRTIIAIDSCLGRESNVGIIKINNTPVNPGAGVGKDLPEVGDYSILAVTNTDNMFNFYNTNLRLVYRLSRILAKAIIIASANKLKQCKTS